MEQHLAWRGETIEKEFGVSLGREAIWVRLLELNYLLKRTRYALAQQVGSEVVADHQTSLETLKRGNWSKD